MTILPCALARAAKTLENCEAEEGSRTQRGVWILESTRGRPLASLGHLNQTIFPHNRSLQGAIATWMRPFACSQMPTGVGLCAPTGVAALPPGIRDRREDRARESLRARERHEFDARLRRA